MRNLPLAVLKFVDEGIACLDLVAEEVKLINARILAPVGTDHDVAFQNNTLWLLLEEVHEIIFDGTVVGTGNVANSRQQDTLLGVSLGDGIGIQGVEGVVPEVEQTAYFGLRDGLGDVDALRHDRGMVVGNLPLSTLEDIRVRVSCLDDVTGGSQDELLGE